MKSTGIETGNGEQVGTDGRSGGVTRNGAGLKEEALRNEAEDPKDTVAMDEEAEWINLKNRNPRKEKSDE